MTRLEKKLSNTSREGIFQMLRTREVYQYDVTDASTIVHLVSAYTDVPEDIILGYLIAKTAVAKADIDNFFKKAADSIAKMCRLA